MEPVAVCALTFKRPEGLARLLSGLADLTPLEVPHRVVIVDNDPEESGRAVVEAHRAGFPVPLAYVPEPRRGIATARNRAVAEAAPAATVVFIDDDEWPDPNWLVDLMATMASTGARVVTGPVEPVLAEGAPGWVAAGRFFDRPRFADQAAIGWATTSNVAIDLATLGADPFDARFDRTGGEDTHLFHRLRLAGVPMAWCDTAVVHELIPVSRTTAAWLNRRQYRRGQTLSTCLRLLEDSPARRAKRLGRAVGEAATGLGLILSAVARGKVALVKGTQRLAFAGGLVSGLFGRAYTEYDTTHGS